MINKPKCTAILLAAGKGRRMGSEVYKQFLIIKNKPVLYYSLQCFETSDIIDDIILVAGNDMEGQCRQIIEENGFTKVSAIVTGGKERYDSVYNGLLSCKNPDYVFIHDGARPFITTDILERCFETVQKSGACVTGMPSKDTVKISDENGFVTDTPDRRKVWIIQTPQVFSYKLILDAHRKIRDEGTEGITDDAMIIERMTDVRVKLAEGSYDNIKITTPEDIAVAEAILNSRTPDE